MICKSRKKYAIYINNEEKKVNTGNIGSYLDNQGKLSEEDWGTTQTIILVKDGKEYTGEAIMKAKKFL